MVRDMKGREIKEGDRIVYVWGDVRSEELDVVSRNGILGTVETWYGHEWESREEFVDLRRTRLDHCLLVVNEPKVMSEPKFTIWRS